MLFDYQQSAGADNQSYQSATEEVEQLWKRTILAS